MSGTSRARTLLFELSENEIKDLATGTGVGAAWARNAKVSFDELSRGRSRAVKAIRAGIRREPRVFIQDLGESCAAYFSTWTALAEGGDFDGDPWAYAARALGGIAGPSVAKACLACIAEANVPIRDEVAERLDELSALTEDPLAVTVDDDPDEEDAAPEIDDDVAVNEQSPDSHVPDVDTLLDRTRALHADGLELASALRSLAEAIERGEPTPEVDPRSNEWSAEVRELLASARLMASAADNLVALENSLIELQDARKRKLVDARKALDTVVYLRAQGLEAVVPGALAELGFVSVEEAEALLRVASGEVTTGLVAVTGAPTPEVPSPDIGQLLAQKPSVIEEPAEDEDRDNIVDPRIASDDDDDDITLAKHDLNVRDDEPGQRTTASQSDRPGPLGETTPARKRSEPQYVEVSQHSAGSAAQITAENAGASSTTSLNPPEARGAAEDPLPEQPWVQGDGSSPPLIAQLVLRGQYALACHVGLACPGVTEHQRLLLSLTCAAAKCSSAALEPSLPQLLPNDSDVDQFGTDEVRVLLAASLRAGLRLGYAPLGLQTLIDRAELAPIGFEPVVQALATTVQRGRTRENTSMPGAGEELASRWAELGDEARELRKSLERKNLIWGRASRVLRHLVRDAQPLGRALGNATLLCGRGIDGASDSLWAELESQGEDLLDQGKRDRMIVSAHRAVSSGPQRREVIEAAARTQLHDNLSAVGALLGRIATIRRAILNADDIKGVESAQDLDRAMAAAPPNMIPKTVGDAALISLIEWRRHRVSEQVYESLDEVLDLELLPVFELPRDADGRPSRHPTASEVALLLEPRDPETVVVGHLMRGDLAAARTYISESGLEGQFDDALLRAARDGEKRHDAALSEAEFGTARLKSLYKDELARELLGEIDSVRIPHKERFDLSISALKAITARADAELETLRADLLKRTAATSAAAHDKARVVDLIEQQDETLAVEFLTRIESGQPLPEIAPDHGDDFREFFPTVVDVAAAAQTQNTDPLAAARAVLTKLEDPEDRQLRDGLRGWRNIRKEKRRDQHVFRARVAEVLRMIGLVPRSTDWIREISRTQRSGYTTYRVWASPVDRSYVPQLGTQAHSTYDITFVWDRATPQRLLDFIDERNRATQANVIFYFGVLSTRERAQLRHLTLAGRGKGFSPLVIDEAVIAWLTSRQEPGWRFTQRVTLPFTTINPYSPFAGGEVPDEVFVGRDDERLRIESPTGSMFVYGGRQLGKSALLRRVERLFNQSSHSAGEQTARSGNVAIYIDLKAAGIGEAREPAELWPLLGERLRHAGVIQGKPARSSSADDVTAQITQWIQAEPDNRLLVLLDEADNFLTVDANAGASTRGAFPVLQALKGVMESSHRRFKPVFAGLHQVQRFHDTSNTPVAHGGKDILIGPLDSRDAYSLVVDPLHALGYSFASPELVWRLLLVTNYQASLVQIVCEALVRHMQARSLPVDGGRILVEDQDVRAVCEEKSVQDLIAQRFRWTINLDSRYRVIALVVALRSRAVNEPASAFSVDDLRDDCEYFWEVGFNRDILSRKEFERYLAEMVGLGVLHRQGDRYGLRSPNIIRMLGSQESLDQELQDADRHLDAAFEYNPMMARKIFGESVGFWLPRSPLTDYDLALLVNDANPPVQIVCGSAALAIERAASAIASAADEREYRCVIAESALIPELNQHHFGKRTHIVVDLSKSSTGVDMPKLVRSLQGKKNLSASIVVAPNYELWVDDLGVPTHYLRRWSVDGLRAWYESPFDSPTLRQKLYRVTSGWPMLIERAMESVRDGRPAEAVLDELSVFLSQPEVAEMILRTTAIDQNVAKQWATWFTHSASDGLIESQSVLVSDLSEALGRDGAPALAALEALDLVTKDDDGWVLDRVVAAAAAEHFID
ncbi:hypothetical protein ACFQWH_09555 [Mycolicibacterium sp. GCM10028919]|uniref:hypothetical protein n=1 Tax=Mycolicibacterium sp. GCM10028919 TaxID=3273401 RepID=UPI0036068F90